MRLVSDFLSCRPNLEVADLAPAAVFLPGSRREHLGTAARASKKEARPGARPARPGNAGECAFAILANEVECAFTS
jgi:hypothetical protein